MGDGYNNGIQGVQMQRLVHWAVMAALFLFTACSSGGGGGSGTPPDNNATPTAPVVSDFNGSVDEDAVDGTIIGTLTVDESGSTVTGIVLGGSGEGNFSVDANGVLKVAVGASLDFEQLTDYTLQAVATNAEGSSAPATVAIHVNNKFDLIIKTAQTTSYVANDDGHYQKGLDRNYTRDDGNDIVNDHVSKLMWQDDSSAASITRVWLTSASFIAGNYDDTSGDTAATYCEDLALGGYSDWRLPDARELKSIVDYSAFNPSINPIFENVVSNDYWSGTTRDPDPQRALKVDFESGDGYMVMKDDAYYVRCVRNAE